MNSKQRVAAAMAHKEPDRVPVMCQLSLGHYFLFSGFDPVDIWFDSETFIKALLNRQQAYGFDGIIINLPGRPENWRDYILKRYEQDGKKAIQWKNQVTTLVPSDDNPHSYGNDLEALLAADYQKLDAVDPALFRLPGYVWGTWHAPSLWDVPSGTMLDKAEHYPDWFTRGLKIAKQLAPDISIHAEVFSPLTHLMEIFGYQNALMAMFDVPDKCHQLLQIFTQQVKAQIDCCARHKPDAVLMSSAFAGAGFISREFYQEFVVPYERQVVSHIKSHGTFSYVHTCGAIGDRLDLMAQSGFDGVDTLDPPPLGTVDLAKAKSEFGQRFFFKGNLDSVNELLNADDDVFEKAVKERLQIGMPGGGYILSTACSVSPRVKPERLKRLLEITQTYGRYK